jgi:hypothetical protein
MKTLTEALRPLSSMGTATEIAKFLEEECITGFPEDCDSCPIANYLKKELGCELVSVSQQLIELKPAGDSIVPNQAIVDFINSFDAGNYDFLLDESYGDEEDDYDD